MCVAAVVLVGAVIDGGDNGQPDSARTLAPGPDAVLRALGGGVALGPPTTEADGETAGEVAVVQPDVPEYPEAVPAEGSIADVICSYPWPCSEAVAIAQCESTLRPDAISWTGESFGLFQVHSLHAYRWPDFWESWSDPVRNTEYAFELWSEHGWAPWDCW